MLTQRLSAQNQHESTRQRHQAAMASSVTGAGSHGGVPVPMPVMMDMSACCVTYTYEEGAEPAEFFLPFVWEVTVSGMATELAWKYSQIALFE